METDLIGILKSCEHDPILGSIAKEALILIDGSEVKFHQSKGSGQPSQSVVWMYRIRMGLKKFKKDAFIGLEESISSLSKREVVVHLAVIETERVLISLWLAEDSGKPIGIVIAKFDSAAVEM